MIRSLPVLTGLLLLGMVRPANAQRFVALGLPDTEVLATVRKLQKAIGAGDRATVVGMVNYPMHLNLGPDSHTTFASRAQLISRYDAVFTADIRRAVVSQNLADLLGSTDGLALAHGLVWLTSSCGTSRPRTCRLGITSVNHPRPK